MMLDQMSLAYNYLSKTLLFCKNKSCNIFQIFTSGLFSSTWQTCSSSSPFSFSLEWFVDSPTDAGKGDIYENGDVVCENNLGVSPLKPTFMLKTLEEKLEARTTWLDLKKGPFCTWKLIFWGKRRSNHLKFHQTPQWAGSFLCSWLNQDELDNAGCSTTRWTILNIQFHWRKGFYKSCFCHLKPFMLYFELKCFPKKVKTKKAKKSTQYKSGVNVWHVPLCQGTRDHNQNLFDPNTVDNFSVVSISINI